MRTISTLAAQRIARHYANRPPLSVTMETASWSRDSVWHSELSFKLRTDDGSPWAKLGHGPIRKMVVVQFRENSKTAFVAIH